MNDPSFWLNPQHAATVTKRVSALTKEILDWERLQKDVSDLLRLAQDDQQDQSVNITAEIEAEMKRVVAEIEKKEFVILFDGQYDRSDAIVSFHAGSGGTDSMDWAAMLERMIIRFCENKGFEVKGIDRHAGDVAGIKSCTIEVKGEFVYGWLKGEAGVHRLVRISPFDAEQMRHTSFALIDIVPVFDEVEEVAIDPKDLRIDTFLSSGHGGQSVQTTYSAVRIVHIPTGIMVSCQNERSQLQNREIAMKVLKAKLFQKRLEAQQAQRAEVRGEVVSAEWGNQIRSYVLHPYKMVKDHRTGYEMQDPLSVLEGDLDRFEEEYLKWRKSQ